MTVGLAQTSLAVGIAYTAVGEGWKALEDAAAVPMATPVVAAASPTPASQLLEVA